MSRSCMSCGRPINECMGFVLPRDICRALAGEIACSAIRELCSFCADTFDWGTIAHEINESPTLKALVTGAASP